MSQHAWYRFACLAIFFTASITLLRIAGIETPAVAGPAGTAGLSLPDQVDSPILLVKDVNKPKKGCLLCNDKGYCLDSNNKESCQVDKSVVEKTWGPGFKWKCRCSQKSKSPSKETACCWPSDNPASKTCGGAREARTAAVINYPGKLIECGPYQ